MSAEHNDGACGAYPCLANQHAEDEAGTSAGKRSAQAHPAYKVQV